MASQMMFFRKNWADYERPYVSISATEDSASTAPLVADRSNKTGWGTQGSVDANNTKLTVNLGDLVNVDTVLLINHNFASILLEQWTGSAWATVITVSGITASTTKLSFTSVQTTQLRLTIYGTQVANSDKFLSQFIATQLIGQLAGWPVMKKPTLAKNLTEQQTLSGKSLILQNQGFYSVSLAVQCWSDPTGADMAIVETLYGSPEGFLFWPCGGDQAQFRSVRQGYSLLDIFLVRCRNEFTPEWYGGLYNTAMQIQIDLVEVTT